MNVSMWTSDVQKKKLSWYGLEFNLIFCLCHLLEIHLNLHIQFFRFINADFFFCFMWIFALCFLCVCFVVVFVPVGWILNMYNGPISLFTLKPTRALATNEMCSAKLFIDFHIKMKCYTFCLQDTPNEPKGMYLKFDHSLECSMCSFLFAQKREIIYAWIGTMFYLFTLLSTSLKCLFQCFRNLSR